MQAIILTVQITNNADFEQIPILSLRFLNSNFKLIKNYDIADPDISIKPSQSEFATFVVPDIVLPPSKVYIFFNN